MRSTEQTLYFIREMETQSEKVFRYNPLNTIIIETQLINND